MIRSNLIRCNLEEIVSSFLKSSSSQSDRRSPLICCWRKVSEYCSKPIASRRRTSCGKTTILCKYYDYVCCHKHCKLDHIHYNTCNNRSRSVHKSTELDFVLHVHVVRRVYRRSYLECIILIKKRKCQEAKNRKLGLEALRWYRKLL